MALTLGLCPLAVACAEDEPEIEDDDVDVEPDPEFYVEVEINQMVDFSSYASFDIVDPSLDADGEAPAQFLEVQADLEEAIVAELRTRGLTRDTESPQLLVNPLVNREVAISIQRFYEAYYGSYWGYDYIWTIDYDYSLGTLVLDVIDRAALEDPEDDLLIYRGAAHGLMAEDLELIEAQIEPVIDAMFDRWPT